MSLPRLRIISRVAPRSPTQIFFATLILLTVAGHLCYLWSVRTPVPHQDEWAELDHMFGAEDSGKLLQWLLTPYNGHFAVPAALAYLISLKLFALDLTPLRLLNFAICLAMFLLGVRVLRKHCTSATLRYYMAFCLACITFNLCVWEHFTQAGAFTTLLSVLFAAIGLHYVASRAEGKLVPGSHLRFGAAWFAASVLSFGTGYLAVAAALATAICQRIRLVRADHQRGIYRLLADFVVAVGLLTCVLSHPLWKFGGAITRNLYHAILVAGSFAAVPFDGAAALQAGFYCGLLVFGIAFAMFYRFVFASKARRQYCLERFGISLTVFGIFCSLAVALVRWWLPPEEFLSSRYTLYPCVCLAGFLFYAARHLLLVGSLGGVLAMSYLGAYVREHETAKYRPAAYAAIATIMKNIDNVSDDELARTLYWRKNPAAVRRVVARMRAQRLNIFRQP